VIFKKIKASPVHTGADQAAAEVCPLRLGSNVTFQHDLNQWQRRNGFEAWR
jgi:hypothetical protein